jgi:hypothetical protein
MTRTHSLLLELKAKYPPVASLRHLRDTKSYLKMQDLRYEARCFGIVNESNPELVSGLHMLNSSPAQTTQFISIPVVSTQKVVLSH